MSQSESVDSNDPNALMAACIEALNEQLEQEGKRLDCDGDRGEELVERLAAWIHDNYEDYQDVSDAPEGSASPDASQSLDEEPDYFNACDRILYAHKLEFRHEERDSDVARAELSRIVRECGESPRDAESSYDPDVDSLGLETPPSSPESSNSEAADESSSGECKRRRSGDE